MRQLLAIIGMAILAGCASSPKEQQQTTSTSTVNDKSERVSRRLSVAWDNMGRGGAALRPPGYVHVLGNGNVGAVQNAASNIGISVGVPEAVKQIDLNEALNTFKSLNKGQGYSLYELSRWERYCHNGDGMDEYDWLFVEAEGPNNFPKEVVTRCIPPAHTYRDYLTAWTRFCKNQAVTDTDRGIVRDSVRPFSLVDPCKALE